MAAILRNNRSGVVGRTVGVARVFAVGIFHRDVVGVFGVGKVKFAFAVSHPDANLAASQRVEHHRIVGANLNAHKRRLKLVRIVVQQFRMVGAARVDEFQFVHQLTTVANAERQSVGTLVEVFEGLASLLVVLERACPTLCRAEYVAVGESAAINDEIDILQSLPARSEVGHVYVLHVEARKIHRVSHFAVAVDALFADYCSLDAGLGTTLGVDAVLREFAAKF